LRGGLLGGLCAALVLEALEIVALDRVAYKDFMESMKLVLGAELALCSDPGPADPLVEVSLNDAANRVNQRPEGKPSRAPNDTPAISCSGYKS